MNTITPKEANTMIKAGDVKVVDVRTPSEFSDGHIMGAVNIDINGSGFEKEIKKLDPNEKYVVNCQGGGRSARACSLMEGIGFRSAMNLEGGIAAWKKEGLPVVL